MNRNQPRPAKLRVPNGENPLFEVNIGEVQSQRFADPQSRHTEQPIERIAHPPRYAGCAHSMLQSLREQAVNRVVGIQIEAVAASSTRHHFRRRHLGARINSTVVDRKSSYGAESQPLITWINRGVLAHPSDDPLPGDPSRALSLHEGNEVKKPLLVSLQLESQRPARRK